MTDLDPYLYADQILPLGGPYNPEAVTATAALCAELVRRLNHATFRGENSLPYPSSVDRLVTNLNGAVAGLPQLLGQLAQRLDTFADDPNLYADAAAKGQPAPEVAACAAVFLRDEAAPRAEWLADALTQARQFTARLGLREMP